MKALRIEYTVLVLTAIVIIASTSTFATGQIFKIISPSAMANVEGDASVRPNVAPNRLQFFFPASDFAGLPSSQQLLVAFNFRGDQSQTQAVDRIFPDGEFWISTTDKTSATLSTVFAKNHGTNKTLVHSGLYTQHVLGSGTPREIADGKRFQQPFYYDPSQGNLLIEHIWHTQGSPVFQPALDVQSGLDFTVLAGGNPDATSGTLFTGRSITQFEFAAPPPGDFNLDGTVNAADYTVWRDTLGHTGTGLAADGDGDGTISEFDYGVWRANYGMSIASNVEASRLVSSVPEPATVSVAWVGILTLATGFRIANIRRRP